jgi:multiple sugar transport system substrate-binding protein
MKRLNKKIITLCLVMVIASLLTACVGTGVSAPEPTPAPTAAPEPTKASDPTKAPTPTPVPERYPAFDFGGRTIKVGIWWDYYYTSIHTSINDDPGLSNAETAQMKLDNVRRIEEKYNCRIEYINLGWTPIIESINTSIAAGSPECDIYLTDLQFGIPAALNGLAQDLKKIAHPNSDLFGEQIVLKPLEALGATYFFQEQGLPQSGIFLGYNATMIEDLGLEDPQELYNKGQWTWEKFAEYAKAGTRDTDNDGSIDVYGYGGVFTDFVNGIVMNNGGSIAGSATEGLSSKPVVEALEFINRLYNVDISARPWNADDWNDNLLAWSDGKVMFWTGQAWLNKQEIDAAANEGGTLPFDFHIVPYPVGPSGDGTIYSPVAGNWYIVPVGVKEPEKVLQIFEEFHNWHAGATEYRDDPTWFESCFTTMEDVELAYKCGTNLKMDLWTSMSDSFDFGGAIWWPIVVDKTSTVAQAVEAAKPVLQDALDALFGN